jgi:ABC-type multidrug transport system ATPase subunit
MVFKSGSGKHARSQWFSSPDRRKDTAVVPRMPSVPEHKHSTSESNHSSAEPTVSDADSKREPDFYDYDLEPHLSWNDLHVESISTFRRHKHHILKGISGRLAPHRLTCVLGPSGAGKSSLMNVLSGRIANSMNMKVAGSISYDNKEVHYRNLRDRIAYVMQHDCLLATNTAREAILFGATMRGVPNPEERTEKIMKQLGLSHVADTIIGGGGEGGLSGGEKRRVAIGVELVSEPNIVFLDEPTSGLDYFSAHRLVEQLSYMRSKHGLTMFCSIHQPAPEILDMFDDVLFMAHGMIIYHGPLHGVRKYFKSFGLEPPVDEKNIGNFVIHLLQTLKKPVLEGIARKWSDQMAASSSIYALTSSDDPETEIPPSPPTRPTSRSKRTWTLTIKTPPNAFMVCYYLVLRELRHYLRDTATLMTKFGIAVGLSIFIGIIMLNAGDMSLPDYQVSAHFNILFLFLMMQLLAASQSVVVGYPIERRVFIREYSSGTYGVIPYVFSKLVLSFPTNFLTVLLSWICIYWLGSLNGPYVFHTFYFSRSHGKW